MSGFFGGPDSTLHTLNLVKKLKGNAKQISAYFSRFFFFFKSSSSGRASVFWLRFFFGSAQKKPVYMSYDVLYVPVNKAFLTKLEKLKVLEL